MKFIEFDTYDESLVAVSEKVYKFLIKNFDKIKYGYLRQYYLPYHRTTTTESGNVKICKKISRCWAIDLIK